MVFLNCCISNVIIYIDLYQASFSPIYLFSIHVSYDSFKLLAQTLIVIYIAFKKDGIPFPFSLFLLNLVCFSVYTYISCTTRFHLSYYCFSYIVLLTRVIFSSLLFLFLYLEYIVLQLQTLVHLCYVFSTNWMELFSMSIYDG